MTAHACPACKAKAFVWSLEEEVSPNTQWYCMACSFAAEEDESKEDWCARCRDRSAIWLLTSPGPGHWCLECGSLTEAAPKPAEIADRLGYDDKWFAAGVIDDAVLRAQWATWLRSDDHNADHHRHGAFVTYLSTTVALSDDQVRALLELRCAGPDDHDLSVNRVHELLRWPGLRDDQLAALLDWSGVATESTRKLQLRVRLSRQLHAEGLTNAFWQRVRDSGDGALHERILRHEHAQHMHFVWLAAHGANRSIRNQARQRSRQRPRPGQATEESS